MIKQIITFALFAVAAITVATAQTTLSGTASEVEASHRKLGWFGAAGAIALTAGITAFLMLGSSSSEPTSTAPPAAAVPSAPVASPLIGDSHDTVPDASLPPSGLTATTDASPVGKAGPAPTKVKSRKGKGKGKRKGKGKGRRGRARPVVKPALSHTPLTTKEAESKPAPETKETNVLDDLMRERKP